MQIDKFYNHLVKLKETKRSGWVKNKIKNPESVADHSYAVAMLALTVSLPKGVDRNKLVKMALVHDFAESLTGDLIHEGPNKSIDTNKKKQLEINAVKKIFSKEPDLLKLVMESLNNKTKEAKLLSELDKLEMFMQSKYYETKTGKSLEEFQKSAVKAVKSKTLKKYLKEV